MTGDQEAPFRTGRREWTWQEDSRRARLRADGLGHRAGARPPGYKTIVREVETGVLEEGPRPHREVPRRRRREGQGHAEARTRRSQPVGHDEARGPQGLRPRSSRRSSRTSTRRRRPTPRSTPSSATTRSSARTPRRSASPSWRRRRSGRTGSAGCTSSTRCR